MGLDLDGDGHKNRCLLAVGEEVMSYDWDDWADGRTDTNDGAWAWVGGIRIADSGGLWLCACGVSSWFTSFLALALHPLLQITTHGPMDRISQCIDMPRGFLVWSQELHHDIAELVAYTWRPRRRRIELLTA